MKISLANPLLGAHMSIAGGAYKALVQGESIGCTAIQIFTASNRQWSSKLMSEADAAQFISVKKESSIEMVVSHASYLINVGSSNSLNAQKSVEALKAELLRCEQLEVPYMVIHPGSYSGSDEVTCMDTIIHNLDEVLETTPGNCMILLENSAGQGSSIGTSFEQLAYMRKGIHHKKRIGFCIDTCHAFVAGYEFSTPKSYHHFWETFDQVLGLEHLKTIHLNDSKKGLGSRVDRHSHIGEGAMGLEAFRLIMNDKNLVHIPKLLETPKEKDLKDDVKNLATLRSLIG